MSYFTDPQGLVLIEKMQESIIDKTSKAISDIIKKNGHTKDFKLLDIACGTSYVIYESLKNKKNVTYKGIDLDESSLKLAKNRWKNSSHKYELINEDVLSYSFYNYDILTCFSNTLLSFGTIDQISTFLKNLAKYNNNALGIFSFTPWDEKRISYYNFLKDWQNIDDSQKFKVKVSSKICDKKVKHKVFFKDLEANLNSHADFSFLAFSVDQFINLLITSGWKDITFIDSVSGVEVDPKDSNCIDFLVVCRAQ